MSNAIERLKTYEEGLRDGFINGQEKSNKVMEQMLQTSCNSVICNLPETEAIKLLKERIKELEKSNENLANQSMILCQRNAELEMLVQKLKCCENCKHYKPAVTVNETIGNMCEDFENGCNNSEISPYNKWELSD